MKNITIKEMYLQESSELEENFPIILNITYT